MKRPILTSLLVVALMVMPTYAADEKKPAPAPAAPDEHSSGSKVVLDWEHFKALSGWGDPSESKITLPWGEVMELLGIELGGIEQAKVKISWQEFKKLIKWSLEKKGGKPLEPKPPVAFVVTSADYNGTATKDGVHLTLQMTVDLLQGEGWKRIAILPADVAIEKVTLPDGCFLESSGGFYTMLTRNSGRIKLSVNFAISVRESQGIFSGSFNRVPSGASTLTVKLDEKDAELSILGAQTVIHKEETAVAALPSAGQVTISWKRAIKEEKAPAKIYSESHTLVSVAEGVMICRQNVRSSILHNKVDSFSFKLPEGVNVHSASGMNVRDWRTEGDTLKIDLAYPLIGDWNAVITTEKSIGKDDAVEVPVLKPLNVESEKGFVAVVAMSNVEIRTSGMTGASAIDVSEVPPSLIGATNQPILLSYRYMSGDFSIKLGISKHDDVALLLTAVDTASAMVVQTEDGILLTDILMNVRNSRNQFLKLRMPEGCEVWSALVAGQPAKPAMAPDGTMLIPLVRSGSAVGHAAFPVEITYVIKGKPLSKKGEDDLRIRFPRMTAPITHFMCTIYMPDGFEVPDDRDDFAGTLRYVKSFTPLSGGFGTAVVTAEAGVEQLKRIEEQQAERVAASHGVETISVKLPVHGKPFRLEKILAIDEELWTEFEYEYGD